MDGLYRTFLGAEIKYQYNKEQFSIQDQLWQFLMESDVLLWFHWRLIDQILGRIDQILTKDYPNNKKIQEVPPLSSFFLISSVPLTEGNNRNFARGSPTVLPFSFVFVFLVNRIGLPLDSPFSPLIIIIFKSVLAKPNFKYQNCGIFHNFSVGIFQRQLGECGNPWSLNEVWFEFCGSGRK